MKPSWAIQRVILEAPGAGTLGITPLGALNVPTLSYTVYQRTFESGGCVRRRGNTEELETSSVGEGYVLRCVDRPFPFLGDENPNEGKAPYHVSRRAGSPHPGDHLSACVRLHRKTKEEGVA